MPQISLKAARVNANLTQEEAAIKLGVSISTIKKWEKGETFPKQPKINQICELYGISYDHIFFG